MLEPVIPSCETERMEDLHSLKVLDTPQEDNFDRVTRCAQRVFGMPVALISLVDKERQWFKSHQGTELLEAPRNISFCGHAILGAGAFVVEDATKDERFSDNPLVAGPLHLRFYAGMPLHGAQGYNVGTLCLLDYVPRVFTEADVKTLKDLAGWAELELNSYVLGEAIFQAKESESRLRTVVDNVNDAMITINDKGVIETVNAATERIFGYAESQIVGCNIRALMPELFSGALADALVHPRDAGMTAVMEMNRQGFGWRKNGSTFPLELTVSEMRMAGKRRFLGIVRDISERHLAQAQLRVTQERLSLALEGSELAIWDWDIITQRVYLSERWSQMCGGPWETSVVDAGELDSMVHPDDMKRRRQQAIAVIKGDQEIYHVEHRIRRMDGEWTWVESHGKVVERDVVGRALRMAGTNTDISMRKQVEDSLRESRAQAEAASRAKGEFVANMSHEIRTPLNAVLGMAHLLGDTEMAVDQRKYLDMILMSGKSLLHLINDILDFSKIEAGAMILAPTPFHLDDLLNVLGSIMSANAADRELELIIGVDPDVPRNLNGDGLRLQQVLVNLASNAIKFTEHGEVSVLVSVVERQLERVTLRFSVRDTGIGISEEQQSRLFSPFTQADSSTTRRFGGTGLGLTISRHLIKMMDGRIDVHSEAGVGSRFDVTVSLPLARLPQTSQRPSRQMGSLRVLIVDDNQTSRDYLLKTVAGWKWSVDSADSGAAAIERVRAAETDKAYYDAILIDWQMPGMDGVATMQAIRALTPASSMPVIIMVSAFGRSKLLQADAASQIDAVLIKPVTGSSLFDTLHEVLSAHSGSAQQIAIAAPVQAARPRLDGVRLLLVEDHPLNQIVARGMLTKAGATIDVADNGQIAVDRLRMDAGRYDLVLMDVQMPVMDGHAAAHMIRTELLLTLPMVAMTAGVTQSERDRCIESGMDDVIAKPIDYDNMLATILRHLPASGAPSEDPGLIDVTAMLAAGAPTAEVTAPANTLAPCYDLDRMLAAMNRDHDLLRTYITTFLSTSQDMLSEIASALEAADVGRLHRAAHTIKSVVGYFHAADAIGAAEKLERTVRSGDLKAAAVDFATLGTEVGRLVSGLFILLHSELSD